MYACFGFEEPDLARFLETVGIPHDPSDISDDLLLIMRDTDNEDDWPRNPGVETHLAGVVRLHTMVYELVDGYADIDDGSIDLNDEETRKMITRARSVLAGTLQYFDDLVAEKSNKQPKE